MPAVTRAVTALSHTTPTALAANPGLAANVPDGDLFPNSGSAFVIMSNTGGSTYTVTEAFADQVDGITVPGRVFSLTAGSSQLVKLGPPKTYGQVTKLTAENVAVKFAAYRV
jgi:hypothetical protein